MNKTTWEEITFDIDAFCVHILRITCVYSFNVLQQQKTDLVLDGELGENINVCIGGSSYLGFETSERSAE